MTTKEALVRLNQPFSYPPDTDSYFDAKRVAMKSLEKDLSIIKELEKIKEEIAQIDKIYYPDLSFYETRDCYIQRKSVAEVIDKHISELKGE